MFVLLLRICTFVRLGLFSKSLCFYLCVVIESLYTFEDGHFGNKPLCLYLCCCGEYVHRLDWAFWYQSTTDSSDISLVSYYYTISLYLSFSLYLYLCISLYLYISISPPFYLSIYLSLYCHNISIYLSINIYLFISIYISLSLCLYIFMICRTGMFGNDTLYLYMSFCIGYVHM